MRRDSEPKPSPSHLLNSSAAHVLRWAGLIGILAITVMRCVIFFAPQLWFDVDPALNQSQLGGLGPGGSLVLDVIVMLACACALLGEWRSGRGVDPLLCALALLPLPIVLWHGTHDAGDLWRGSTWAAAAIACCVIAHLAREQRMRIVMTAVLVAVIVPVLVRGAFQVLHEHAQTVAAFEETKEQFLRDRGWEPGSPAALIYERRLRQPQPTGWFISTNIFASMVGFGMVMFAGLAIAAVRSRMAMPKRGWVALMAVCAAACAAGLIATGSKGAILATMIGMAALLKVALLPRVARIFAGRAGLVLMSLIAVALLAVAARGLVLPEKFAGDRSLLFRWHYTIASARIVAANPIVGVGPDGYQQAYTLHRVPRNPEEVASAHSMFWDWLAAYGMFGIGWIALVLVVVFRAGLPLRDASPPPAQKTDAPSIIAIAIASLAVLAAIAAEWNTLGSYAIELRVLGAAGFAVIALLIVQLCLHLDRRLLHMFFLAAAAVLLVHGQIEMIVHQPGSVLWAMCVVGLIGSARSGRAGPSAAAAAISTVVITGAAAWLALGGALPALWQESKVKDAALMLGPIRQRPNDELFIVQTRNAAALQLRIAYEIWPANVLPLEAAAIQLQLAASAAPQTSSQVAMLSTARDVVERAMAEHDRTSVIAITQAVHLHMAQLTDDEKLWLLSIALAQRLTQLDPNGIVSWRRLGHTYWLRGDRASAAAAYRRALESDANFELDELKRLSESERRELFRRMQDNLGVRDNR